MTGWLYLRISVAMVLLASTMQLPLLAQPITTLVPQTQPAQTEGEISFNFPDNVPLKTFVEYATERLGLNVIFDDQILGQRVTIKSAEKVPPSALRPLLENVLKMKGLALVDADQPGWKKIVAMSSVAQPTAGETAAGGEPVTQIFRLHHGDPSQLDPLVKPLLTNPGGSATAIPEQGLLVVSDFKPVIARVAELVRLIEESSQNVTIEFIPVKHADASQLAAQVSQLLTSLRGKRGANEAQAGSVAYDPRTNQIVIIDDKTIVAQAKSMIASLDVAVAQERSPVRFYKLANTTASDVLATIKALETGEGNAKPQSGGENGRDGVGAPTTAPTLNNSLNSGFPDVTDTRAANDAKSSMSRDYSSQASSSAAQAAPQSIHTRTARIASDPHTNTIIVEADPVAQKSYEALIKQLDKRRPQVLIEATVVTLDTSRGYTFGVEISGHGGGPNGNQYLVFSSFGLSTINSAGRLAIIPGLGFNGALISTEIADVVIRALEDNTQAKVSSAPKILVNDNSTGNLVSNQEQPFTSNNFNNTVSTTSFGGYAEAGTQISFTPHISESDYLQLEYAITLSNFTDQSTVPGIPPARQTNLVQSKVTIPDGSTIIVGGLNRQNYMRTVRSIPILGDIPIVKYFFSNRTVTDDKSTLFIFIRPIILRDDQFADLKFLSDRDLKMAKQPGTFPSSEPVMLQ